MHGHTMKSGVSFNYNGGYDGDICISAPGFHDPDQRYEIRVDFEDLKSLVCDAIRQKRIEAIENMSENELLGILE